MRKHIGREQTVERRETAGINEKHSTNNGQHSHSLTNEMFGVVLEDHHSDRMPQKTSLEVLSVATPRNGGTIISGNSRYTRNVTAIGGPLHSAGGHSRAPDLLQVGAGGAAAAAGRFQLLPAFASLVWQSFSAPVPTHRISQCSHGT